MAEIPKFDPKKDLENSKRKDPKGEPIKNKQLSFIEEKEISFDERPSAEELSNLINDIKELRANLERCRRILTLDHEFQEMLDNFYELNRIKITGTNINKKDYTNINRACREIQNHLTEILIDFLEVPEE